MENSEKHTSSTQVQEHLNAAYRSFLSKKNGIALLRGMLILFAGLTALIISEHVLYLSAATKTVLSSLLLLLTGFSVWKGFKTIHRGQFKEFYREFSRKSNLPELKDTLDLEKTGQGNRALIDAAILQNLGKIKDERLNQTLSDYIKNSESYTVYNKFLGFSIATLLVFGLSALNFGSATQRSFTFWESFEKPNPYTYAVAPGDITVEQGSSFQVDIAFRGDLIPEDVSLKVKTSVEENFRTRVMEFSGNTFSSIPQELNDNLQYYVQMDGYKSELYHADVQLRPRFSQLQATVIPPAYTQLDSSIVSYPISQLRAYEGSTIRLSGELNKSINSLQLSTAKEFIDLFIEPDSTFSYDINVTEPDTLRFHIEDENGLTNRNPFQIIVAPQSDEYPLVELIEPEQSFQEVNPQEIELLYRASDDFGLTSASLHYELNRAYVDKPFSESVNLEQPGNGSLQPYMWDLDDLELKPQDELTFWISVQDNDRYNGFKSSLSQKITLTVPSLVDYFEDMNTKEDEVETDLDDISESFKQVQDQYEQFKEKMKDNPENPGYEEKKELEQVQKQQEEIQKKVEELNSKFEQLKRELNKDDMLSEETQKAYEELQKLLKEIDDPAFREALRKMQEQLGQMNPEQLRKAMEELEFNEELYKERLERTIELFKQLKLNSDLDKLAKSFEDMARKEEKQSQNEEGDQNEDRKEQVEKSIEENEKLKEQVVSLSKNTSPKNEKAVKEYQEKTQEELDRLLEESKEEIAKEKGGNDSQESEEEKETNDEDGQEQDKQNQKDNSRKERYQQLAESTKSLMEGINQEQMNINIAGLQYVLYSLLNLSLEQEDLTTLASATENRSQAYVTHARNQRNVGAIFSAISDSLYQLSSEIPQFSNQINKKKLEVEKRLKRSLEQMSERNREQSSVASRQALGGINDISFMIANLLDQLQNSQNGGGGGGMSMEQMMEQLQQSGEQQQQLNQQLQEMINDIQGERLSQDQMERLNQIAKQQNKIRKQLQEMQRRGELDGDKIGSELERMIEDMEDTINDLRGGTTDPIMIERQQNILSRMLEAEQAMQERDEEDKREGNIAEEYEQSRPAELTLEEMEKQIQNRLNDPNFTKYSPDYQRLIENYFELLKQLQDREIQ